MKQVFKLTFPNRKVFIGKDGRGSITCFEGYSREAVEADFRNVILPAFSITKEVLWESEKAGEEEMETVVERYVRMFRADDPQFGYNNQG